MAARVTVFLFLTLNFHQNGFESSSALGSFRVLMWKPKTLWWVLSPRAARCQGAAKWCWESCTRFAHKGDVTAETQIRDFWMLSGELQSLPENEDLKN